MRVLSIKLALAVLLLASPAPGANADGLRIFAAASLKTALDEVIVSWNSARPAETHSAVGVYAATSALAKQIEEGAPADLFISADLAWMDELEKKSLVRPGTRRDLLTNTLVLIAPAGAGTPSGQTPESVLEQLLHDGRLALGKTDSVPAGKYARQALESLGIWNAVKDRLAEQVNVRAALQLVARGETPLGIVYGSDAHASPGVTVVAAFPEASHRPIVYPAAIVASSIHPQAEEFLAFLPSPAAAAIFAANGFGMAR